MTSSLRHETKFLGLFLQIPKVQSNIYRLVGWNQLYLEWFSSYSQLKMSSIGGRERFERDSRDSRERVGYRNISCTLVIVPWLKVRREGAFFSKILHCTVWYCWMTLQVDKCSNEDPGPLPGPRCTLHYAFMAWTLGSTTIVEPSETWGFCNLHRPISIIALKLNSLWVFLLSSNADPVASSLAS